MTPDPILENRFNYHPLKAQQPQTYEEMRNKYKALAYHISSVCPNSRELATALTHLETSMFWANAAIARNQ